MNAAAYWPTAYLAVALSASAQQGNLRSWSLLNGLDGGLIQNVVAGEGTLIALTARHNAFRSRDTGKSWQPFPIGQGFASSISFDGTGKLFYGIGDSGLVMVAEPDAPSWRKLVDAAGNPVRSSGLFSADGPTIISFPLRESITFPSRDTGIQISRDGGKTWRLSFNPVTGINPLGILAADSCVYLGDMDYPISVSCDGGATWTAGGGDTWEGDLGIRSVSNYAYGMVRDGAAVLAVATGGIIRSLDRGKTWRSWEGNLRTFDGVWRIWRSGDGLYVWHKDGIIYRSRDGGVSWSALPGTQTSDGGWPPEIMAEAGDRLFAATPLGLQVSPDSGKTWAPQPFGLMQSPILALGIHGQKYLALSELGISSSPDSGATWRLALPNDAGTVWSIFGGTGGRYAAGTLGGKVRVTLDGGDTWSPAGSLPGQSLTGLGFVGATCFAGTLQGLHSSNDQGGTWVPVPMPQAEIPRILASDGRSLLIGGDSRIWELGADGRFSELTAGLAPLQVQSFWLAGEERFAITRDGGLHRWDASGQPSDSASGPGWRRMPRFDGLPFAVAGSGKSLVLATSTGTYTILDGGTWQPVRANNLRGQQIRTLAFDGGFAFGGDGHGGLWRLAPAFPQTPVSVLPARRKPFLPGFRGIRSVLREAGKRLDGRSVP